jgi:hypothetical protein
MKVTMTPAVAAVVTISPERPRRWPAAVVVATTMRGRLLLQLRPRRPPAAIPNGSRASRPRAAMRKIRRTATG